MKPETNEPIIDDEISLDQVETIEIIPEQIPQEKPKFRFKKIIDFKIDELENKDILKIIKLSNNDETLSYQRIVKRDGVVYKLKELKTTYLPTGVLADYISKDDKHLYIPCETESNSITKYANDTILWREEKGIIIAKNNNKIVSGTNFHLNSKLKLKLNDYLEIVNGECRIVLKPNIFWDKVLHQDAKLIWIINTLTNSLTNK